MGVKNFTHIFKPVAVVKSIDHPVAVDTFVQIFSASSMQYAANLTNSRGESTLYIKITLANALKRLNKGDIWVWDSGHDLNSIKSKALRQRTDLKNVANDEIGKLRTEIEEISHTDFSALGLSSEELVKQKNAELNILLSRNPDGNLFRRMCRDIHFILSSLGVTMVTAPRNSDAEQVCAQLCREGLVQGVISTDTDTIIYGAPKLYKKVPGKPEYAVYDYDDCLKQHDLTPKQLVDVALAMGCDFCEKTPRIGEKTVIQKVKSGSINFTQEQELARERFAPKDLKYTVEKNTINNKSVEDLKKWLVDEHDFNALVVEKMFQFIK